MSSYIQFCEVSSDLSRNQPFFYTTLFVIDKIFPLGRGKKASSTVRSSNSFKVSVVFTIKHFFSRTWY